MASEYPGSPFGDVIEGFTAGWSTGYDLQKKRNDLRISQLGFDAAEKQSKLAGSAGGSTGGGKAYMDPFTTGAGSAGSGGSPGSSTGGGGRGGGGGTRRAYTGSQEGGVDPGDLSGYMKNQLGATDEELGVLVPAAGAESSYRPNVTHDPDKDGVPTGYGLWGHRLTRLDDMYKFTGIEPGQPVPWQSQAAFALSELRSRQEGKELRPGMTPEELTDIQMRFEQPNTKGPTRGNIDQRLSLTRSYLANPPMAQAIGAPDMATAGQGANAPEFRRAMDIPLPSERNRSFDLGPPGQPAAAPAGGDYADFARRNPGVSQDQYNRSFNPARAPGSAALGDPMPIGGNRYAALMRNPTNPWGGMQPAAFGGDARNTTPTLPEYGGGVGPSAMDFAAGTDRSPIAALGNPGGPTGSDRWQDYQRPPLYDDRGAGSPGGATGSDWGDVAVTGRGDPRRNPYTYNYSSGPDQLEVTGNDPRTSRYMYRRSFQY